MQQFIRTLSPRSEFWITVCIAFGPSLAVSLLIVTGVLAPYHFTNDRLWRNGGVEMVLGALAGTFLFLRGWTAPRLGLRPGWKDIGLGPLVLIGMWVFIALILFATWYVAPGLLQQMAAMRAGLVQGAISPVTAIVLSPINAIFEEVFVAAYVIAALRPGHGAWMAVAVSAAIRASYHFYQGPMAVVAILPMGLLFGTWYARTGRLWPLIIAHTIQDIGALLIHPGH